MELRNRSISKGPLPEGNRRGTPGAGAGRFSMRTTGGEGLPGRPSAGSPEQCEFSASSALTSSDEYKCDSKAVSPASDVSRAAIATQPVTTKAGKPRVRMKWDEEINTFIMRTYFYITKLETDRTMYVKKLFDQFQLKYPHINVTSQRIADQRRVIIRNKLLSDEQIKSLKQQAAKIIENEKAENNISDSRSDTRDTNHMTAGNSNLDLFSRRQSSPPSSLFETQSITLTSDSATQTLSMSCTAQTSILSVSHPAEINLPDDGLVQKLTNELKTNLALYTGTDPNIRPKLPRLKENKHLYSLLNIFNSHILPKFYSIDSEILHIHTLIYCSALVISKLLGYKISNGPLKKRNSFNNKPAWQIRLEIDISILRADVARLTQFINNNRHPRLVKKIDLIFDKYKVHSTYDKNNIRPAEFLDTLKQKLALKTQRLARYKKALQRKEDNRLFQTNEKGFYRMLKHNVNNVSNEPKEVPTEEELKNYWTEIWKKNNEHNEQASWINEEENKAKAIELMEFTEVTKLEIEHVTKKMKNWKATGPDNVHNFWFKKFSALHDILAKIITDILKGSSEIPSFVTVGTTFMIPKSDKTADPSQYRPITCLPTIYKLITSCIALKINTHLTHNKVLAEEQKGCRQNHRGCKEQLIIDSIVIKHATSHNRNLNLTYIDYKKAFDSVPHSWLIRVLQIYKINPDIISFLERVMGTWKTKLHLNDGSKTIVTDDIPIANGIFQGDSLSPLWFCLALNPLSSLLNKNNHGYKLTKDTYVNHLMYMDDIKLFAKSEKEMNALIKITAEFSKDINMTFGLNKCKTLKLHKGRVNSSTESQYDMFTLMDENDTYKYLGLREGRCIDHTAIKKDLSNEYLRRLNLVCKKQLNSRNLFKAINTFAIPILTYSFGVIKWSTTDIRNLEIKTRTTITKHKYLHPKSAIERLTIKRAIGGRSLIDLKRLWEGQVKNLQSFFYEKSANSPLHQAVIESDNNYTPLNLSNQGNRFTTVIDHEKGKLSKWRSKELHGRHAHDLEQPHIDLLASNKWLKIGSLFPETEGFLIAIQDQVINTRNYKKYILKDPNMQNDSCRKCHRQPETIQHITGACPSLVQTDYTHRHNQVANYVHQKLANKHNLIPNQKLLPYYQYTPKPVLESDSHRMYFDRAILTDKTIHYNRPDITLIDKLNKTVYLIDIAIPNTHNIQKTITEKNHKYTELKEEVTRIWKMNKVYIVPLVLSSTGVIPKCLSLSLKRLDLPENSYITMQKAAILNTCRIVRKFLQEDISDFDSQIDAHLA